MEYVSLTFWLLVIVFTALGVHQLWTSLVQPKVVNMLLLPGTLVAQIGRIIGLLVTGGTVNNTTLIKDDDSGEPATGDDAKPRIPIIGTIIVALLPMAGCAIAVYWVSRYLGAGILPNMGDASVKSFDFTFSLSCFFSLLHLGIDMVARLVFAIRHSDLMDWRTLLFLYLAICLTVRMAPLTGNVRGAIGAIFLTGLLAFLVGQIAGAASGFLVPVWPLVTFSVAVLLGLLILSLVVKGVISLIGICSNQG